MRPYDCPTCKKTFNFKHHLTGHIFVCSGNYDEKFKCDIYNVCDDQGRLLGGHLIQVVFFFFFFRLEMQNYFIPVIRNYINDKNYTP